MSDQPQRTLGGVVATPMPQDFVERLAPHEPVVTPPGVRPSGPPVPDRRPQQVVPAGVSIITAIPVGPDESHT